MGEQFAARLVMRLWGELIEVPGLVGDFIEDFGRALQRLTLWLRRWDPDPDIRTYARGQVPTPPPAQRDPAGPTDGGGV